MSFASQISPATAHRHLAAVSHTRGPERASEGFSRRPALVPQLHLFTQPAGLLAQAITHGTMDLRRPVPENLSTVLLLRWMPPMEVSSSSGTSDDRTPQPRGCGVLVSLVSWLSPMSEVLSETLGDPPDHCSKPGYTAQRAQSNENLGPPCLSSAKRAPCPANERPESGGVTLQRLSLLLRGNGRVARGRGPALLLWSAWHAENEDVRAARLNGLR